MTEPTVTRAKSHKMDCICTGCEKLRDAAAALARRDAETRLDEADWWIKTFGLAGDVFDMANSRIAGLTSQLDEAKAPKDAQR